MILPVLPQLLDNSRKLPLGEVPALVLPLIEHGGGAHIGVVVERHPAVHVVPAHDGPALVVHRAVAVDLGDRARDRETREAARASRGERVVEGE